MKCGFWEGEDHSLPVVMSCDRRCGEDCVLGNDPLRQSFCPAEMVVAREWVAGLPRRVANWLSLGKNQL